MTYATAFRRGLKPDPKLSMSEWSEANFILSPESSAEPGPWRCWPYQRGILDALGDPAIEILVWQKGAREGYSKCLDIAIAYHIAEAPCPQLIVQPTVDDAEGFSKDELAPMLRDVEVLRDKVADPRARDSGNTLLKKSYTGGALTLVGANSPRGFRRLTVRCVWFDEVDAYPASAGSEGDQIKLGMMRSSTYWNRKVAIGSTPTVKGFSRIEDWFLRSDQRRYFVPCPECGEYQVLRWGGKGAAFGIKWPEGNPREAFYLCERCGCAIPHRKKRWMVERGEWRATAPFNGIAGFHIWAAYSYSPKANWGLLAEEFVEAKRAAEDGNVELLKTFVNTVLGETWEEQGEQVEHHALMSRREDYDLEVLPDGVLVLTAGVDVQGDRLEAELLGWGKGDETWSVDYVVLQGDPGTPEVWQQLDRWLLAGHATSWGGHLSAAAVCIDSGGHHAQAVYDFVRPRQTRRVHAIKGSSVAGKPIIGRVGKVAKGSVGLVTVGTEAAKDWLMSALQVEEEGPGFCHFPARYDEEFFAQLTAEKAVAAWKNGQKVRRYVKTRRRNEALDCRVYAVAARMLLNPDYDAIAANYETRDKREDAEVENPKPAPVRRPRKSRRKKGWAQSW